MRKTVYVIFALAVVLALLPAAATAQDLTRTREVQGSICHWSSLTVTPNPESFDDFVDGSNYLDVTVNVSTNYRRNWDLSVTVADISSTIKPGESRNTGYMHNAGAGENLTNALTILGPHTDPNYEPLTSPVTIVQESDIATRRYSTDDNGGAGYCQCIDMETDFAGDYNIYLKYTAVIAHT